MINKTVLLIEDNEELNEINRRALELKGCRVLSAKTLEEAREILAAFPNLDVILLDVMLPDGDGIVFCGEIRDKTDAHILFLTSRTEYEDRVKGLNVGGDDYITKPYHPEELISRVASAMRRREMSKSPPKSLSFGSLTLYVVSGIALEGGRDLLLSAKEFAILFTLAQNAGKLLSAVQLYEEVWRLPMMGNNRTLRTHVYELRKKMADASCSCTVISIYGKGYCFEKINGY